MRHFGTKVLAVAGLCLAAAVAQASDVADKYPEKMVRIIVPYAPGGFNDTLGRIFAQQGVETLGGSPEAFEQFF